jgi:hypothetical protein
MPHYMPEDPKKYMSFAEMRRRQDAGDRNVDDRDMPSRILNPPIYCPAGAKVDQAMQRDRKSLWTQGNVVMAFDCNICGKPRTSHSIADSHEDYAKLQVYLEKYPAVCGQPLITYGGVLQEKYLTQQKDTCKTQVKAVYYAAAAKLLNVSGNGLNPLRCVHCGSGDDMMPDKGERREDTGQKLRPQCHACGDKEQVPHGRKHQAIAAASDAAIAATGHRSMHASAAAAAREGGGVSILPAAALEAQRRAAQHLAASERAAAEIVAANTPLVLEEQIADGQEELAKRQRTRRGYGRSGCRCR